MKYFSLFSGIGGFELGIQQAYENYNSSRQQTEQISEDLPQHLSDTKRSDGDGRRDSPTCIGYSEIDKYAIQIYEKHFNHKNYGDITKIKAEELPDFELLCGGFPCQSFSIAGKRMGFSDTRGTLFFEIARIAREKQPRLLLLENVKGLLSHDKGITFYTIISTLDELGYDLQWQVLNSKNFGVPQNRERVFIIGHLRGTSRPKVFPIGGSTKENSKIGQFSETSIEREVSRTLLARDYKDPKLVQLKRIGKLNVYNTDAQAGKIYDPSGVSPTVSGQRVNSQGWIRQLNQPKHSNDRIYGTDGVSPTLNTAQGGNRQPFVAPVLTPDRKEKRQNGRRMKEDGEPSFTLTGQDIHGVMIGSTQKNAARMKGISPALTEAMGKGGGHVPMQLKDAKIRRLTPTECERLQGFPDGWTEGVSDTQRYKTLGNAVTVNVIKEIACKVIHS